MKKVISKNKLPIKMWLDDCEDGAIEQASNLANLPFAFKHIALMPDCHQGYGMPIGGVMATDGVIVPNAVGVDIGCGVCAVKTSLTDIDTDTLKKIMGEIRKQIPLGFKHHRDPQDEELMPDISIIREDAPDGVCVKEYDAALYQLGTLGGGNHFIEIQKGSDGHIWIMIHSGSRNLGKRVADHYNKIAKEINRKWYSSIPLDYDLAFLPINNSKIIYSGRSGESVIAYIKFNDGVDYFREMQYCVDFAFANRKLMMKRIQDIIMDVIYKKHQADSDVVGYTVIEFDDMINIAHNYASMENHFGKNVLVHRKGATLAKEDTIGIIPGSQGTSSYIVKGKGNPESFMSCSHGAGRKMSRKKAEEELDLEEEKKKLDDKGIIHAIRGVKDLDEASGAYKDIDVVMENQKDLVEILVKLEPLAVIKG